MAVVVGLSMAAAGVEDLQMKSEQREIDEHIFCFVVVVSHNRGAR